MGHSSTTTVGDTLRAVSAYLPEELISSHALKRISQVAELSSVSHPLAIGFECRLDDIDTVDLLIAGADSELLPQGIREFWLEFDVDESSSPAHTPSIFFKLPHDQDHAARLEILKRITLSFFPEGSVTARIFDAMELLTSSLPPDSRIDQIGLMFSRSSKDIRIVMKIPNSPVMNYLDAIRWPGDRDQIARLISDLSPIVDFMGLNFDVGERISPKIGLEGHFNNRLQPWQDSVRWSAFLDFLVSSGLCAKRKRDALLALPREMSEGSLRIIHHLVILGHIKIACFAGRQKAKAYFCLLNSL